MKKLIVLIMVVCLLLPVGIVTGAEPDDDKDKFIPPVDEYTYRLTPDDIHELFGLPDDKGDSKILEQDVYYDVTYFDLAGHLKFTYINNQVVSISWESPIQPMTEEQIEEIIDAVEKYYDEKVGTEEDQKGFFSNPIGIDMYSWIDEFNKTDYNLQISTRDGLTQIYITKSKRR